MVKCPVYLHDKSYMVIKNGVEIGSIIEDRLYRYDLKGLPFQTYDIIRGKVIQHCHIIGRIEGLKVVMHKGDEVFDLIEK